MNALTTPVYETDRFAEKLQICFELQKSRSLICEHADTDLGLNYSSRYISAVPKHLRTHIRRIYFAIRKGDSPRLVGALIDLFLVLRGKGKALVNRVIDQAEPLLDKQTLSALRKFADTSDFRFIRSLPLEYSVLVNGSLSVSPQCFNPAQFEACA
ncbi:hypothetical protein ADINL_3069 [Nitrincola lacisaponensis]|uniref:Uncharacterized protein n=1 Tax=Nitrincola lacisaponensis TaxID=267850 RepID=A0A063XYN8_9GAMM|nr:hypothetical protein [Nitrincola lacisaponensis]KDE38614.1 hypothetical protein ADINL_3069 [Nitrincola lacisaponensis]